MCSNTYKVKININGNDEVCDGGEYNVTSSSNALEFKEDWEKCKDELTAEGGMWESPDEIIAKMEALGYEFDSCNWDTIEVEA